MAANTRWVVAGAVNVTLGVVAMVPALALFVGLVAESGDPMRPRNLWWGALGVLAVVVAFVLVNRFSGSARQPRHWAAGLLLLAVPTAVLLLVILVDLRPG